MTEKTELLERLEQAKQMMRDAKDRRCKEFKEGERIENEVLGKLRELIDLQIKLQLESLGITEKDGYNIHPKYSSYGRRIYVRDDTTVIGSYQSSTGVEFDIILGTNIDETKVREDIQLFRDRIVAEEERVKVANEIYQELKESITYQNDYRMEYEKRDIWQGNKLECKKDGKDDWRNNSRIELGIEKADKFNLSFAFRMELSNKEKAIEIWNKLKEIQKETMKNE